MASNREMPSTNKERDRKRKAIKKEDLPEDSTKVFISSIQNSSNDSERGSTYIHPGNQEKETYRLSTFMKFPHSISVDVYLLATHGFLYTGYKDRVKCFSCGSSKQDWAVGDDPKSTRWHLNECKLVLGTETLNQPIGGRPVHFQRTLDFSLNERSLDTFHSSFTETECQMPSSSHSLNLKESTEVQITEGRQIEEKSASNLHKKYTVETKRDSSHHAENAASRETFRAPSIETGIKEIHIITKLAKCEITEESSNETTAKECDKVFSYTVIQPKNSQLLNMAENLEELENRKKCKACRNHVANMLVMACSHIALCSTCIKELKICPLCGTKIEETMKVERGRTITKNVFN